MNRLWIVILLLLAVSVGSTSAQNVSAMSPLADPAWIQVSTGGDTICGHGLPYSFFYHEGASNKLLIDFQGGGMCWNGQTCSATQDKTFDDWVDPNDGSDNPGAGGVGIMDLNNPQNPFGDYDIVYVDYCTGDMHTGDKDQGYTYNDTYYDVKHMGAVNDAAVMNWTYATYPDPSSVFVVGCSAGSVGAAYWTADIAQHYSAPVTLLGNSGGGWRGIPGETWTLWGTNYQGVTGANLNIPRFYTGAARAGAKVTEFNTINDGTQTFFTQVGFSGVGYQDALRANLQDITRGARSFRYFTGDGDFHCITPRNDFYSYSSNAIRVRDWVADLADGQPVNTVICTACAASQ